MSNRPKRINRELVYKGTILDIYNDTMDVGNGKIEQWDIVSHRKGAACIVPVLPDGKILMVRQYRSAIERDTLEIPAGARNSVTEDTLVCAVREMEEETGYKSDKVSKLLELRTTVAFCNEMVDVYLAEDLYPGKQHLDDAEDIKVEAHELEELLEMIYSGKMQDAKTVAAILAYAHKVNK
ncbi:MAG: NUDIX hydrolase [Agathobacter sp.]|nr:NUDIX hydrolase [Agathobacter sp.]